MDFKNLLFSWKGRISRKPYWIGMAILIVTQIVLNVVAAKVPLLGLLGLVVVYSSICVYATRLHDLGLSGWVQLVPYVVMIAAVIAAGVMLAPTLAGMTDGGPGDEAAILQAIAGSGAAVALAVAVLVSIGFTIWLGVARGQAEANRFGPPPGAKPTDVF